MHDVRREGGQTVDVAVVHAERRGDQHRVVDLQIGGALFAGRGDQFGSDLAARLLYGARDVQRRA